VQAASRTVASEVQRDMVHLQEVIKGPKSREHAIAA